MTSRHVTQSTQQSQVYYIQLEIAGYSGDSWRSSHLVVVRGSTRNNGASRNVTERDVTACHTVDPVP
eukprot:275146-Amorphochlora_amoeboformis.AAC.1